MLFIALITDRQYRCTGLAVAAVKLLRRSILQDSKGVETGDFNKRICSYRVDPRANVFSELLWLSVDTHTVCAELDEVRWHHPSIPLRMNEVHGY